MKVLGSIRILRRAVGQSPVGRVGALATTTGVAIAWVLACLMSLSFNLAWAQNSTETDENDLQELLVTGSHEGSSARSDEKTVSEWLFPPSEFAPLFKKGRSRPELPKPNLVWVDARGKVTRKSLPTAFRWVWVSDETNPEVKYPVLRVFFALPEGAKLEDAVSSSTKRIPTSETEWQSALKEASDPEEEQVLVFEGLNSQLTGSLQFELNGKSEQLGWIVRLNPGTPILWTHPRCLDRGLALGSPGQISAVVEGASSEFAVSPLMAVSLYCRFAGNRILLSLKRTSDSEWLGAKVIHPDSGVFQDLSMVSTTSRSLTFSLLEWEWSPESLIKEAALQEGDYTEVAAFRLRGTESLDEGSSPFLVGVVRSRGWEGQLSSPIRTGLSWNLGLGMSMVDYVEDFGQTARLRMVTSTLTGGMLWRFHPRWDVGLSGFVNGLPLSLEATRDVSGAETTLDSSVNYYGLNLRGGWRFSSPRGTLDWRLAAGFYFWGMLVNPPEFGIRSLIGPQFFVQLRNNQKQSRPWGAYIKYAVTGSGFAYQFANFEAAGGGDIQLGRLFEKPISATIDVAYTQFSGVGVDSTGTSFEKNLNMTSLSLGARIQF